MLSFGTTATSPTKAYRQGLRVIPGISDFPYVQMAARLLLLLLLLLSLLV